MASCCFGDKRSWLTREVNRKGGRGDYEGSVYLTCNTGSSFTAIPIDLAARAISGDTDPMFSGRQKLLPPFCIRPVGRRIRALLVSYEGAQGQLFGLSSPNRGHDDLSTS